MRVPAVLLFLLAVFATSAPAFGGVPAGPRLATVELIETKGSEGDENASPPIMSLAPVDPATGKQKRFLRAPFAESDRLVPFPFYGPAWSNDGSSIAFTGVLGGESAKARIFLAGAGGGGVRPVLGTARGTNPVLSPDGHTLAFARSRSHFGRDFYSSTTTWIIDLRGGRPRRVTPWREGLSNVPGSFTADGSGLLLTKDDDNPDDPRIVQLNLSDGTSREILRYATEPVLSPDGSRIAFTGYLHPDLVEAEEGRDYHAKELYVADADGDDVKRLSRTDNVLESSPSWDPSGQRIGYVQFRADTSFVPTLGLLFPVGNALMQVNADGSCREKILTQKRVAFYGVAWQPGPGREAGPIIC